MAIRRQSKFALGPPGEAFAGRIVLVPVASPFESALDVFRALYCSALERGFAPLLRELKDARADVVLRRAVERCQTLQSERTNKGDKRAAT